jgi:hypothetical protein
MFGMRAGLLALLLAVVTAPSASAHALGVECQVVGARVTIEAFYDDDTPAVHARVAVHDAGKRLVAEGRTNAQGRWSFDRPAAGRYEVTVNAGGGHRTSVPIVVPEAVSASGDVTAEGKREDDTADRAPATRRVSEGPTREEFTRIPWLNTGIGLGVIAVVSLAFWWARHQEARQRSTPKSNG